MPHLHSSLGRELFSGHDAHARRATGISSRRSSRGCSATSACIRDVLEREVVDLTLDVSAEDLGTEPSLTLVAGPRADLFRKYDVPDTLEVAGELKVNPLYRVERRGDSSVLTLTFPTPEYEEEFGACQEYLPRQLTVRGGSHRPNRAGDTRSGLRRAAAPARHHRRAT